MTSTCPPGPCTPGLIRLAVGIDSFDDILADLDQGFTVGREGVSVVGAVASNAEDGSKGD